ncbi:PAS domain S-box protein [Desertifilum sp. FACHB-1129]|uniref:Circadian input-output histidine kinase CikA n=1 Tax=Desertifilum tharense IPPAS B-1220 TaxID=1781255 RepID=A0A1E5QNK0_9CYAN|nr:MULTISPECIES: PAS domain S-box protein [Desertifilum]MDA0212205.1 PAS domain S-box protein [Cyanobacteria bacterium FC1]MBD2312784.1 PAS domain S-box protein [Desertifilum sp. FACHB-1129]MBD2324148.1 PAS domain S-box protein [Desertifilum sp. FACHB-866]MBD2334162.1 PAS domain S-box protein [Desertifilum sp. FACHB-868]OEJ76230.1 hypothetical protein BH720_05170 [Desertifilum tharense IPPAS B-1220]
MLIRRSQVERYGVAVASVGIALLLMLLLEPLLNVSQAPFLLFFGAVTLSAYYGGFKAGMLATGISAIATTYFLIVPQASLSLDWAATGRLSLFIFQCTLISSLCEALQRSKQQAQAHLARLKQSEERFRLALGNPGIVAFTQDTQLRYQWIHNPQFKRRSIDWVGKTDFDVFSPAEAEHLTRIKQQVLQTGTPTREEVALTIEGTLQYYDLMSEPLFDDRDRVVGIACTAVNITERKQIEQQLESATQDVTNILESIADAFFAVDRDWRFTYVNRQFELSSNRPREALLGQNLWEVFPDIVESDFYREYHRAMAQQVPVSVEAISVPNSRRWFAARCYPRPNGVAVYYQEITQKKLAEQRLAAQYAVTRVLSEVMTLPEAVPSILQSLCQTLGLPVGVVWRVEDNVLRYVNHWCSPETDRQAFIEQTQSLTFAPQEGILGQILATHQPIWIADIRQEEGFIRASEALEQGLYAVFGFPILFGNEILGAIECFSDRPAEPDPDLLQMMAAIGTQIGQFMERQRTQDALKESRNLFESFMTHSPFSAYIKDESGHFIYVNDRVVRFFNRPAADFIGKTDFDLFPVEVAQQVCANDAEVLATQQAIRVVETVPFESGETRYYMSFKFPLRDGVQRQLLAGVSIDISDRIRAEEALRISDERFRLATRAVMGVVYDWDLQANTIYRSEGLSNLLGLHPQELAHHRESWLDRVHPEDIPQLQEMLLSLQDNKRDRYESEYRIRHRDGRWIDVWDRGYLIRDRQGRLIRVVGSTVDITERKQAEAEKQRLLDQIRTERELLETVLQQMPAGVIIAEAPSGKLLLGNAQVAEIWGTSFRQAETIDQYQGYSGFHEDGRPYRPEEWPLARAVSRGEVVVDEEIGFLRGDGTRGTMLVNATPVRDRQGNITAGVVTFNDISDRTSAVAALQESEARFRGVVESEMVGILFWESEGDLLDANTVALQLLGYDRAEIQARQVSWRAITPTEYHSLDEAMLAQILSTGSCPPFEKEFIRKDGSRIPILLGCALLPGYRDRGVAFLLDMTERKAAEMAQKLLSESSAVLVRSLDYQNTLADIARLIVPTLADFCYMDVVGTDGQVQRIAWQHRNPLWQDRFELIQQFVPSQELQAHPITKVLKSGKTKLVTRIEDEWIQAIASSPEHLEFMRQSQLQSLITVPLIARTRTLGTLTLCTTAESGRFYQNSDLLLAEELAYRIALAIDNSQLYQQAQEANRIKDEFLAVLSHELRSPLNPILGWSKLLLTRKFDEQARRRALETIERNAKLQTQLIEDLLDVSRILRGKMVLTTSAVDLKTTIEAALDTVQLAAGVKSLQIHTALDPDVGLVSGDANRLQQIVWNLLSNAVKFTPDRGSIEVRLEKVDNCAQIQVQDTGKGIKPEFLPHVFEYFRQADSTTTRKFGGLGLGLAIVRNLVELHGGSIFADSLGEGLGATFTVRLPLMQTESFLDLERSPSDAQTQELTDVRVLVVDDEADARELVGFMLEQCGAKPILAASAQEALAVLDRQVPDLLLSDIGMPEINGYQLIQQIRLRSPQQGGTLPAIALTAYAGELDRQSAIAAGFQLHLPKPLEVDRLIEAISNLLL